MRKSTIILSILAMAAVVLMAGFKAIPKSYAQPAGSRTFSIVQEETGDTEKDVANYAAALRAQGWSEQEIASATKRLRESIEKSKRDVAETHTFSVVVDANDVEGYVAALRKQGVSDETIQILKEEFVKHQAMAPQSKNPCKQRTDGAEAYNAYHMLLYRYSSSIRWCYNGSKITYLDTWEQYSTYWGWQFGGSSSSRSGGVGSFSFTIHRYATMYNRVTHAVKHPSTHQSVYANGYSWGSASSG